MIILSSLETGETLAIMESAYSPCSERALLARLPQTRWLVAMRGRLPSSVPVLQLEMLLLVRPITRARVYDLSGGRAQEFANRNNSRLGIEIDPGDNLDTAIRDADIVVTATWATAPFLNPDMIRPGTHITTLGADQPGEAEVSPDFLRSSLFVCDDCDFAVTMGAEGGARVGAEVIDAELKGATVRGCPFPFYTGLVCVISMG